MVTSVLAVCFDTVTSVVAYILAVSGTSVTVVASSLISIVGTSTAMVTFNLNTSIVVAILIGLVVSVASAAVMAMMTLILVDYFETAVLCVAATFSCVFNIIFAVNSTVVCIVIFILIIDNFVAAPFFIS